MTTSGRVVPTALAASPDAPLPLESAAALLVDQQGRLLVNVATAASSAPATKILTQLAAGEATPVAGAGTLRRVTISIYSGTGFLFIFDGLTTAGAVLYTPIPVPTTLPAYIDVEFDTVNGLAFTTGITVAISTTAPAVAVDATATGTVTTSYV